MFFNLIEKLKPVSTYIATAACSLPTCGSSFVLTKAQAAVSKKNPQAKHFCCRSCLRKHTSKVVAARKIARREFQLESLRQINIELGEQA